MPFVICINPFFYCPIHCFSLIVVFCFCLFACLNLILPPPPATQNANANADFANFDAFGSTSGSTGGFHPAAQTPFHPSNTGRASPIHWTKSRSPSHKDMSLYNYIHKCVEIEHVG